ncbi:hypothetical protein BJ956_002602 [Arthrobacter psychrochitiniphilus]|nr:hypothetical protein [Arthrobacter psychrochitiniphilus]
MLPGAAGTEHHQSELIVLDAGPVLNFMGRKDTTNLYLNCLKNMTGKILMWAPSVTS